MKYGFSREGERFNGWDRSNEELLLNLEEIRKGNCPVEEMKAFLLRAIGDADVREDREMAFWSYADPNGMPADTRCDYVYRPTYLMTLILVGMVNRHPDLLNFSDTEEILRYALNACTGRRFRGSGYEAYQELCKNVLLFMQNGIVEFMQKHPLFSVQFEKEFREALNGIEEDCDTDSRRGCGRKDIMDMQKEIVRLRYECRRRGD